jgi:hypothetical protein
VTAGAIDERNGAARERPARRVNELAASATGRERLTVARQPLPNGRRDA